MNDNPSIRESDGGDVDGGYLSQDVDAGVPSGEGINQFRRLDIPKLHLPLIRSDQDLVDVRRWMKYG